MEMTAFLPKGPRRGLVIVGGGAKGAYSFGCLKALREVGVEFDVVAGTSAGSLNATIWSTGQLEEGERLWLQMSPENSYALVSPLKHLPRPLRIVSVLVLLLFAALATRARGLSVSKTLDIPLALGVSAAFCAIIVGISQAVAAGQMKSFLPALAIMGSIVVFLELRKNANNALIMPGCICGAGIFVGIIVQLHLTGWQQYAFMVLGSAISVYLAFSVYKVLDHDWFSAFSSSQLANTIETFLNGSVMRVPTYATIASAWGLFDPDRPLWNELRDVQGNLIREAKPVATMYWLPFYARVDTAPISDATKILLASAALPFGIVPPIQFGSRTFVDGGVADNCPIFPLLEYALDEIFVLALGGESVDSDGERLRCGDIARRLTMLERGIPDKLSSDTRNDPPTIIPYPEFQLWPRIRVFGPENPLGNSLATINFSPRYAKKLIEQGYNDMWRTLSAN